MSTHVRSSMQSFNDCCACFSIYFINFSIRPNIKISVFLVTVMKILGREGIHFFSLFFSGKKKYNFMHLERPKPFKMHKIIFFPESLKKF